MEIVALLIHVFSLIMLFILDEKIAKKLRDRNFREGYGYYVEYLLFVVLWGVSAYILEFFSYFILIIVINIIRWGVMIKHKKEA